MPNEKEILKELIYCDAIEQIMCIKLSDTIELFMSDYEGLKSASMRRELTDTEFVDKADLEADIMSLERVYVMYSGDWDYKSKITGRKIYA